MLGGWQLSNIVNLETGEPLDYYDGSDYFSGTQSGNDRWNLYGDPGTFKWSFSGLPFYPASYDSTTNTAIGRPALHRDRDGAELARHAELRRRLLHLEDTERS